MCGAGRIDFFHHIGNRRFRVMIEMNIQRYEQAYISSFSNNGVGGEQCIQKLIDEILVSLSKCDPPARFLGMDMTNGTWNLLNPVFASLKTETTFFECLQVKQRRQARLLEEELEEEEKCKYFEQCHRNFPNSKSCNIHKYKEGLIYRAHTSGAQIFPSIGGWTLSGSFPQVAADVNKRKRFARECVGLIRDYGFDGTVYYFCLFDLYTK